MRCDDFEARLNDLIDRGLSWESDDALATHAAACGECREVREAYRMLLEGTAALERPLLSESMGPRVLAAWKQEPELTRVPVAESAWQLSRYVPTASWLAALAAGVMLAVVLRPWLTGVPDPAQKASVQVATGSPNSGAPNPATESPHGATDEQPIETIVVENAVATVAPVAEDEVAQGNPFVSGLLDEVADGLSPLRQSTSGALDELVDSLVMVEAPVAQP